MVFAVTFGIGLGYQLVQVRKKENELKQGENHYIASICQSQGLTSFSSLARHIVPIIPYAPVRVGAAACNGLLPVASIVVCPTLAAVKQGHYKQLAACSKVMMGAYFPLAQDFVPEDLNPSRVKFLSDLSENLSRIANLGVLVGIVILPFLGLGSLAAGMAVPVVYRNMEEANLISVRISNLTERYMPSFANAAMLAGGGLFSQVFSFTALASGVPGVSDYVQKKIEKLVLKNLQTGGVTLEEIDAPCLEQNSLSFTEINFILKSDDAGVYEVNHAHCSKFAHASLRIPEDGEFKKFLQLFEEINWVERYQILKSAFRDDERFMVMMKKHFLEVSKDILYRDFETYVEKLAEAESTTKQQYLAKTLTMQMNHLVKVLCREVLPEGFLYDLEDAITSCAQILAYIGGVGASQVEVEDILIKLGIEGGEYCARGIKRASAEIASVIIMQGVAGCDDPLKMYEMKIGQQLQLTRQKIVQMTYMKFVEILVRATKEGKDARIVQNMQTTDQHAVKIAQDVHNMDIFRLIFGLGFIPLTENERRQFGIGEFINWHLYRDIRESMYISYKSQLNAVFAEEGEVHFSNYIRQKISSLSSITQEQKDDLIDEFSMCNDGEKTLHSYQRLFFVMQGVLKVNPLSKDWDAISETMEEESDPVESLDADFSDLVIITK